MYRLKQFEFLASEICSILGRKMIGKDLAVNSIQQLGNEVENCIVLCYPRNKNKLSRIVNNCLVICNEETVVDNKNLSYIISENPKFDFFNFVSEYLVQETDYWIGDVVSVASEKYRDVVFGYNVKIGRNTVIAPGSTIGSNCVIGNNVVIRTNVTIGNECIIKDNTVLGSEGFGYVSGKEKIIHVPQLGSIEIGNGVTLGSCCAIEKPAMGITKIGTNVKIDDLVQIGHNHVIGDNTIVATGFKGIGGCKIGSNCFIGMNVTIVSKKATIGNNCLIGAGAIVTRPVPDDTVFYNKIEIVESDTDDKIKNMLGTPSK